MEEDRTQGEERGFGVFGGAVDLRQSVLLEFVVAAGWHGATANRLAKATFGEPEFPAKENARLSAIYRDLHELEREGKVFRVSSRPMGWAAAGVRP